MTYWKSILIINDTLITSLIVPFIDNTFHILLYKVQSIPVVNIMLCDKLFFSWHWCWTILYLTSRPGCYEVPSFKRSLLFHLGGLCSGQRHTDCAVALYFNDNNAVKSYCSITTNPSPKTVFIQSMACYMSNQSPLWTESDIPLILTFGSICDPIWQKNDVMSAP